MSDYEYNSFSDENDNIKNGGGSDDDTDNENGDEKMFNKDLINSDILIEDLSSFNTNYDKLKKKNISQPILNKFEKTKIISERAQQLANGSFSFLKNPESYESIYEIAMEELRQKKIPFIIKRPISNTFEYWKIEDLENL
jgi:DNA-directed RNA polymerases I, II, and III subunit RPABC2